MVDNWQHPPGYFPGGGGSSGGVSSQRTFTVAAGEDVLANQVVIPSPNGDGTIQAMQGIVADQDFGETTFYNKIVWLSGTTVVVAYRSGTTGYVRAGSVDVDTGAITWGSAVAFSASSPTVPELCRLNDDQFVVVFIEATNGKAVAGKVVGTTITVGAAFTFNAASTSDVTVSRIDDDDALVVYRDVGNSGYPTGRILKYSGDPPAVSSSSAETVLKVSATAYSPRGGVFTAAKGFFVFRNSFSNVSSIVLDLDTTLLTITPQTETVVVSGAIWLYDLIQFDATRAVFSYNSGGVKARVGELNGNQIDWYGQVTADSVTVQIISGFRIDADRLMILSRGSADAMIRYAVGMLDGLSLSFPSSRKGTFSSEAVSYLDGIAVDDMALAAFYSRTGTTDGLYAVGPFEAPKVLGIAQSAGSDGDRIGVTTAGTHGGLSGLTPGSLYGVDLATGQITETGDGLFRGTIDGFALAITDSEVII